MRALAVVVIHELSHNVIQVAGVHHDEPVEAIHLHGLNEPLDVGVEVRRAVGDPLYVSTA